MSGEMLRVENVSRRFGGLLAVNQAAFFAEQDRITALIGPNGAGKTTLFAIITGFLAPTAGRVSSKARISPAFRPICSPGAASHAPSRSRSPSPGSTVAENIAVGAYLHHARRADALAAAEKVAHEVGLTPMLGRLASDLTVAGRKRLELARALAIEPKLLLLDEVLAGLNPSEVRDMVPVIQTIRARGITIVMIEHVMQAVMSLAEQVFVLAEGRIIAMGPPDAIAADVRVIEAYLGHGAAERMRGSAAHG